MCNKIAATIVVDTDLYPIYFSWKLSNTKSDTTIASMGPFQKAYTHYEHTECLEEGKYTFTAYDTMQDGLTDCDDDSCGYHLSVDGEIVLESNDKNFEMKDHTFLIMLPTSMPSANQDVILPPQKKKSKKKKKSPSKKKKAKKKKTKKRNPSKNTERPRGNRRPIFFQKANI